MKKPKLLVIQSYNDIITNSSTEIYSSESNKNLEKTLDELGIDWFSPKNIQDVLSVMKQTIQKKFKDSSFLYDLELGINRTGRYYGKDKYKNGELPKLTRDGYNRLRDLGYCDEVIEQFFDPIYGACGVYGKVYIIYYDHMNLDNLFKQHKRTAHKFKSLGMD